MSAVKRPLLDLCLPHRPPIASVGSGIYPPRTCGLNTARSCIHFVGRSTLLLPRREFFRPNGYLLSAFHAMAFLKKTIRLVKHKTQLSPDTRKLKVWILRKL